MESEGLERFAEALERLCVASLRLVVDESSRLKSRLGGLPDLPEGFVWPRAKELPRFIAPRGSGEPHTPLTFVAEIDLAEVHATGLPLASLLPRAGRLVLFHGYEPSPDGVHVGNAGRVFYFDAATNPEHGKGPS